MEITIYDEKPLLEKYNINSEELNEELEAFLEYWTEPNKKGKQRRELEKTFEPNRRFKTRLRNNKKWNKSRFDKKKNVGITTFG